MTANPVVDLVVIGGGYTGATFAAQLLYRWHHPATTLRRRIRITIVEPGERLGAGIAYSTEDPDHRINAPAIGHVALVDDLTRFQNWFVGTARLQADPDSQREGSLFPRRSEFSRYLAALLRPFQAAGLLRHWRDTAVGIEAPDPAMLEVRTGGGASLSAHLVVLATGHLPVNVPAAISAQARAHPGFAENPWRLTGFESSATDDRVLLVGSGLTAADAIATFRRHGFAGQIDMISRRGLRPQPLPPLTGSPPVSIWERLRAPIPAFLQPTVGAFTTRSLLRALRQRIGQRASEGVLWYEAFDDLRDSLHRLWPQLSTDDQRQFYRHLKPWFDTYRYRMPPQTLDAVRFFEQAGKLTCSAAQIISIDIVDSPDSAQPTNVIGRSDAVFKVLLRPRGSSTTRTEYYHKVINCTGPGQMLDRDPLYRRLMSDGWLCPHPNGTGLALAADASVLDTKGVIDRRIRVAGPQAAGTLGDSVGAIFICAHLDRLVDSVIRQFDLMRHSPA